MEFDAALLNWLRWSGYLLTFLLATLALLSIRPGRVYWPATTLMFALHGARSLYYALAHFPPTGIAIGVDLLAPGAQFVVQVAILLGVLWGLYLIRRQNTVGSGSHVDLDGRAQAPTETEYTTRERSTHADHPVAER